MSDLCWRVVLGRDDPKYMVKGHVLATAFAPGTHSRFMIEEVRRMNADRSMGVAYRVRDAATVSDAEVRDGKMSKVVFYADTIDDCLSWIDDGAKS